MNNIISFKRDTAFRKECFIPESFSHPAKLDSQLLLWIVEKYTKPGETILDCMAGSGTLMLACMLNRNVVLVELEDKFVKMCEANWEKVRQRPQLGYEMGECKIIQGDARNLEGLLVDHCIFSPPYADSPGTPSLGSVNKDDWGNEGTDIVKRRGLEKGYSKNTNGQIGNLPYGNIDSIISSPPFQEAEIRRSGQENSRENYNYGSKLKMQSEHPDNISRLAERNYGNIDQIITSPPYEGILDGKGEGPLVTSKSNTSYKPMPSGYCDSIITSPPYEASVTGKSGIDWTKATRGEKENRKPRDRTIEPSYAHLAGQGQPFNYSDTADNIGNLKGQSYLQEMLKIYNQCWLVLRPQGLLILILKNFIREQKIIRLDLDTIKLCEQAGFVFLERWYRKLPAQSFWRILYRKRFPLVELIEYEDVLVFRKKEVNNG